MIVLVCGGRDYEDYDRVEGVLDQINEDNGDNPLLLIHGDAAGADRLARRWAKEEGIDQVVFPANWVGRGKPAGPYRNRLMMRFLKMAEHARKVVVAFPGNAGTADMIRLAKDAKDDGIELMEVTAA